jgi:hypothetical protein
MRCAYSLGEPLKRRSGIVLPFHSEERVAAGLGRM